MLRIYMAAFCVFFITDVRAGSIETSHEEEHAGMVPVRLEVPQQEDRREVTVEEESSVSDSLIRSGDVEKLEFDKSKLSPTERIDIGRSPGAEMRKLNPAYMDVKVLYERPEVSWWECILENMRQLLRPSVSA